MEGAAGWELDRASRCENLCDVGDGGLIFAELGGELSKAESFVATFVVLYTLQTCTPWKFNIAPENIPSQRKVVFQPSFFRGYVKLRGCRALKNDSCFLRS